MFYADDGHIEGRIADHTPIWVHTNLIAVMIWAVNRLQRQTPLTAIPP